jgi:hypothetical protein
VAVGRFRDLGKKCRLFDLVFKIFFWNSTFAPLFIAKEA